MSTRNTILKYLPANLWKKVASGVCMIIPLAIINGSPVLADGTEILNPTSAELADGSTIIGAGVGLSMSQPGEIEVEVPAGASVEQVLIYWDGADRQYAGAAPVIGDTTDTIDVSGNPVEGVFIGGRTFGTDVQQFAFRADITSLGLVSAGSNTLSISGVDFGTESVETGAGVLVIIDDGGSSTLGLFDGSDYAYIGCEEDGNCLVTVKRMFSFPEASSARDARLTMFFASVRGTASGGGPRPSVVRIWVGAGEPPIEIVNELDSVDGEEWDTLNVEFEVPAGVTQVEVQAFSEDLNLTGNDPASFKWLTAALSVPNEEQGGQGCTPGYWKQEHHFADWTAPYQPDDQFSDYFEDAFEGLSLVQVLDGKGGGLTALGRHTVAALLNAANPEVDYDLTPQAVISEFNDIYPGSKGDYESLKNQFEALNEQGCPLNNSDGSNNSGRPDETGPPSTTSNGAQATSESSAVIDQSGGGAFGFWEMLVFFLAGCRVFMLRQCRSLS